MKKTNNIIFTNFPNCFNITIVEGTDVCHNFTEHFHNSFNIGILSKGEAGFTSNGNKKNIKSDTIYIINPKIIHSIETENTPISYKVISIKEHDFNKILSYKNFNNLIFKEQLIFCKKKSAELLIKIDQILNKKTLLIEKQEILIDIIESFQFENKLEENNNKYDIENTIKYIKENYKENIDLHTISSMSFMSPFHFIRQFKKQIGLSPFDFIIQLRIKEAEKLLLRSNKIVDVYNNIGFYDQSHFTKYFKKYTGVTPKKFLTNYNFCMTENPAIQK